MKITTRNFQKKIPVNPKRIKKAILSSLSLKAKKKFSEITVSVVNEKRIRQLHLQYLGSSIPTDVLAFQAPGVKKDTGILADVVVSADAALRNATTFKTSPAYELYLYVVHGALHLCGYKDATAGQSKEMRKKEDLALKLFSQRVKDHGHR